MRWKGSEVDDALLGAGGNGDYCSWLRFDDS